MPTRCPGTRIALPQARGPGLPPQKRCENVSAGSHSITLSACSSVDCGMPGDAEGFGGSGIRNCPCRTRLSCPSQSNLPESLTANDFVPVSKAHAALYWRLTLRFGGGALPYVLWHFIHHRPLQTGLLCTRATSKSSSASARRPAQSQPTVAFSPHQIVRGRLYPRRVVKRSRFNEGQAGIGIAGSCNWRTAARTETTIEGFAACSGVIFVPRKTGSCNRYGFRRNADIQ